MISQSESRFFFFLPHYNPWQALANSSAKGHHIWPVHPLRRTRGTQYPHAVLHELLDMRGGAEAHGWSSPPQPGLRAGV